MKIAFACDHGGYPLRDPILSYLEDKGYEVLDFGTKSEDRVDYPDYAIKVGEAVAGDQADLGILICGTGIGMSIAANKVKGVRCALCSNAYSAGKAREHNNANVLAMGARVIGRGLALDILDRFLTVDFQGGRHARRVGKIMDYEGE